MLQQPDWTADLLVTALFDPPLDSGNSSPPSLAQTAAAPVEAQLKSGQAEVVRDEVGQTEAVEPKSPWSGTLDIGGVARSGNTTNLGVSAGIEVIYEAAPWRHAGELSFDYLEASGTTEAQVLDAEYQLHYDLTEKTFVYGLTHYEDDRFSGFEYEVTASGGLGTRLIENETLEWTVAAGPSIRVFREKDSDGVETTPGVRLNNDVVWQISETAKLANETEVRLDRERSEVENETSLTLQIIESLAGKFSFAANYRSPVPEDTDELDTTTKASLIYGF